MFARPRTHQTGQILVIFTGGLVALLLIAALVIDLGFTFAIRRAEQNAADPGAIAAARWIRADTSGPNRQMMTESACFYARQNGFFPLATGDDADVNGNPVAPGCVPANDPDGTTLKVNYPPSAAAGDYAGRDGFVEVVIARQHRSFLASVIGIARIGISSSAVAAFSAGDSNNNSLVALDPGDCATGQINGTGGGTLKVIVGGGVQVNSNCGGPVNPPYAGPCLGTGDQALKVSGSNASLSTPASISVVGKCAQNSSAGSITSGDGYVVNQGAVLMGDPLGSLMPPPFDYTTPGQACGGTTHLDATTNNQGCGSGGVPWTGPECPDDNTVTCVPLSPGVYYGGWKISSGKVRLLLSPGIYIIAGGGIQQSGGTIDAVTDANGYPGHVLIYSTDNPYPAYKSACMSSWTSGSTCQGSLSFTAQSKMSAYGLDAATCIAIPSTCPYVGLFMWQDGAGLANMRPDASCPTMSCPVTVGGHAQWNVAGTIYAPDQQVTLDGGALGFSDTATVQVISWQWKLTGTATINMPYDANSLYHFDQKGLVR
jgi:Putative Flp pilus-assembly TadE/G-like